MKNLLVPLLIGLLLLGCSSPPPTPNVEATVRALLPTEIPTATPDIDATVESRIATTTAQPTIAVPVLSPAPTDAPEFTQTPPPEPTSTTAFTATPDPTSTPTATPRPTPTATSGSSNGKPGFMPPFVTTLSPTSVYRPTPTPAPTSTPMPAPTPSSTLTPTPRPTPRPTQRPTATPVPRPVPTWNIPSIDAEVTSIRFYEQGWSLDSYYSRVYRSAFPRHATRYVSWELFLTHPAPNRQTDYVIEAKWYGPRGILFESDTTEAHVREGRTYSSRSDGRGWRTPSQWRIGSYRVDLHVNGRVVASKEFDVVDEPLSRSSEFQKMRNTLPWAVDPLSPEESVDLISLSTISSKDHELAQRISLFPWVQSGPTEDNRAALQLLAVMSEKDVRLARRIAEFEWISDGITSHEQQAIWGLSVAMDSDPKLAELLIMSPFLEGQFRMRNSSALRAMGRLLHRYPSLYSSILSQGWFKDGMSAEEAALLAAFDRDDRFFSPTNFRGMIERHRLESVSITLPLRGEITATGVSHSQGDVRTDVIEVIGEAAAEVEAFMDVPLPVDDLVLIFAGCADLPYNEGCGFWGVNSHSYIVVDPRLAISDARRSLIGVITFYYWRSSSNVPDGFIMEWRNSLNCM